MDALPAGLTLVSATASQGVCNGGVTCDLGDVAVNATATVTIVVTVDSATTGSLLNNARVSASNPELNDADNQASGGHDYRRGRQPGHPEGGPGGRQPERRRLRTRSWSRTRGRRMRRTSSCRTPCRVKSRTPSPLPAVAVVPSLAVCLTCQIARLGVGGQAVIVINGYVSSDAAGTIANTASAVSDADSTGVDSTANTTVAATADVALVVDSHAHGQRRRDGHRDLHGDKQSGRAWRTTSWSRPPSPRDECAQRLDPGQRHDVHEVRGQPEQRARPAIITASVTVDAGTQPGTAWNSQAMRPRTRRTATRSTTATGRTARVIGSCGSDHLQDRHGHGQCR